ncbi:MAG: phosphatase PAP2 family protein [Deltaproteobacteria bacterium]|nr:phosphatase PAP2 family protein [Deltaproteobacteria bacterium]
MLELIKKFDTALFFMINRDWKNGLFDACMPVISEVQYFFIPIAFFWLFLILKKDVKTRTAALVIFAVITTSDIVSARVLKPFFERPRPYQVLPGIDYYRDAWRTTPAKMEASDSTNFSMPSSHATNMFAAAVFLSWFFPGYAWLCLLLALLASYSRPYLGMHYPFDAVAGGVLGSTIGILYALLAEKIAGLFQRKKPSAVPDTENGEIKK